MIDTDDLDKLRTESDKSINIDHFVKPDEIDPLYFAGKTYYLTPDGPAGQKPYALLHRVLADEQLYGVAQVVLLGKEQIVAVRPAGKLLAMTALSYDSEVKQPAAFEDEISDGQFSDKELELTRMLVEATTAEDFDIGQYKDLYTERLTALVEAKVAGQEIVTPPEEEPAAVINLMDALRASVARTKKAGAAKKEAPPTKKAAAKKMAASAPKRKVAAKKKKTGEPDLSLQP